MSDLLLQDEVLAGLEFATADSSAALRNDKQKSGERNDKQKNGERNEESKKDDNCNRRSFDSSVATLGPSLRMTASGVDGNVGVDGYDQADEEDEDGTPFDKLREECGVMAVY